MSACQHHNKESQAIVLLQLIVLVTLVPVASRCLQLYGMAGRIKLLLAGAVVRDLLKQYSL
jgi:hypothetical protein